jgi:hypothetical protein
MIRPGNKSIFLLPILILVCACGYKSSEIMNSTITVTGLAQNGKGGALLVVDDNTVYYLEGMDAWENSMVGTRIEVTGALRIETLSENDLKNEQGEYTQGTAGDKRILTNVKWKLGQE